jgi:formate-dependent nitrite reductase cytochrome c552 subunit
MWSQGVHARSGATCADCHMPRERRGAIHLTVHATGSPRENTGRACLPCHRAGAREMRARIDTIEISQPARSSLERVVKRECSAIYLAAGGRKPPQAGWRCAKPRYQRFSDRPGLPGQIRS